MSAYAQFGYSYPSASQLLVSGGQPTAATSPAISSGGGLSPGALSPSSTATTSTPTVAPGVGTGSVVGTTGTSGGASTPVGSAAPPGSACCENGRPMMTDPVTGQTVCSCQYDSAARLALGAYPRLGPSAASYTSYPTPTPSATDQSPYPSIGMDSSAFYSPLGNPYGLKDATGMGMTADMGSAWGTAGLQPTATRYYPYDPTLAAYGYGAGYDLAARRKNATRESTATLKAWLTEHKKNPYPTKGEKIMLAIITKMTLTQVSTWFANARRRLKKENKMTWEPKNKTDDDDDAVLTDSEDKEKEESSTIGRGERVGDESRRIDETEPMRHVKAEHLQHEKELDDDDDLDLDDDHRRPELTFHHGLEQQQLHHHHLHHQAYEDHLKDEAVKSECGPAGGVPIPATKPKIWSLADTAACKTPPPTHLHHQQYQVHQHHQHYGLQQHQQHQHHQLQHQNQHPHHQHHHHQQQQHQQHHMAQAHHQSQQPWLGSGGELNSFALPSTASMSPSAAATAPYSSAATRYGGFLSTSTGGQLHYNPNSSSGSSSASSSVAAAAAGFPEVGTDTPPQTPPSMKVGTPNGAIQPQPVAYCTGGPVGITNVSSNNTIQSAHYTNHGNNGYLPTSSSAVSVFATRLQSTSRKDFPIHDQSVPHQQGNANLSTVDSSTAFKPFYKGSQPITSGYVSPV